MLFTYMHRKSSTLLKHTLKEISNGLVLYSKP